MSKSSNSEVTFKIQAKKEIKFKPNRQPFQSAKKSTESIISGSIGGQKGKVQVKKVLKKVNKNSASKTKINDDQLEEDKEAVAEILRDTVRSATRAEISGSWRAPKTKVQSRLLDNALSQALQSNRRLSKKSK